MKELSIEEKARAYDRALAKAKEEAIDGYLDAIAVNDIFPELKESEDEKIRKALINKIKCLDEEESKEGYSFYAVDYTADDCIAWLEKQHSKDNVEDVDILHRFSFYSYKDEPNILYLSGLYVNEECRNKGIGTKILEVADEVAESLNCHAIRLKTKKDSNAERLYRTHGYNSLAIEERDEIWLEKQGKQKPTAEEVLIKAGLKPYKDGDQWCILLGDNIQEGICGFGDTIDDALYAFLNDLIKSQKEQKPAEWSEEDKKCLENAIIYCEWARDKAPDLYCYETSEKSINWLKSLRPQNRWKPTEGQMKSLKESCDEHWEPDGLDPLYTLYQDLKKLREE